MCTLTYVPTSTGFIFTHSRDESAKRPSSQKLQKAEGRQGQYYFPQDLKAQGTWMAMQEGDRAACLLNGGSKPYQRKQNYLVSRGSIIPDCFDQTSVEHFYQSHNFSPYEPFTLLVREGNQLYKLVHDPDRTELEELDAQKIQIWSSTKLYDEATRQKRKDQFFIWLKKEPDLNPTTLRDFHLRGENHEDSPGFLINIPNVIETVSLTQIARNSQEASIFYQRLPGMEWDEVAV